MQIEGSTLLITGANRGIGRALVDAALSRGAARVYAGTRVLFEHSDERVVALQIDVTDGRQVAAAAARVEQLDILINNAGIAQYDDLSDPTALETHLAVNLYGTYCVSQAFLPALEQAGGALVNNVSMMALAPFPVTPAYAVSKAAAFNLTQSLRGLLAPLGIGVHAVLTGPTDTDMTRGFEIPKATPESVAEAILDGIEAGEEEIFPDQLSAELADSWRNGPAKAFEHQFAMAVAA
jgi:NAD(P)-dependent dehydrogenase (short-subunit alcohol dehydrogenase family)